MEELKVALLATGDELTQGDISNTNSQTIAQELIKHDLAPGYHMVVSDVLSDIRTAVLFLLQHHHVVITIGGLGPTSDDCTRFAVAEAINRPLIFNEQCWRSIESRFRQLTREIPQSNRQQCLLPENSEVLPNNNGTAAACIIPHNEKMIIMLPGPPNECLPIFHDQVMPRLIKTLPKQQVIRKHWLLLGVSEGDTAERINNLKLSKDITVGYRINYPYLELKISSKNNDSLTQACTKIGELISQYIISDVNQTARQQLVQYISNKQIHLNVIDSATMGALQNQITNHDTYHLLQFTADVTKHEMIILHIDGLKGIWRASPQPVHTELIIRIEFSGQEILITKKMRNYGDKTRYFAVEIICWELVKYLQS